MRILLILLIISVLPSMLSAKNTTDTTGPISLFYNGAEYVKQFNTANGDPFFPVNKNIGSVKYHQNWYNNVEVHYDCEDDLILVRDMRGLLKLRLINEMLEEFFIDDHHFIKKSLDTPNGEFYELLFDGKRTLLVRWKKRLETDVKSTNTYLLKNSIILIEKNKPLNITSQQDIISLAKDHSRELKKTLKENKVSFRKNPIRAAKILVQEMETRGW
ncbi:MAG: hypothetical protein RL640_649 [Bacteroidota bacterium]